MHTSLKSISLVGGIICLLKHSLRRLSCFALLEEALVMYLITTMIKIRLSKLPASCDIAKPLLSAALCAGLGWPQISSCPKPVAREGASAPSALLLSAEMTNTSGRS